MLDRDDRRNRSRWSAATAAATTAATTAATAARCAAAEAAPAAGGASHSRPSRPQRSRSSDEEAPVTVERKPEPRRSCAKRPSASSASPHRSRHEEDGRRGVRGSRDQSGHARRWYARAPPPPHRPATGSATTTITITTRAATNDHREQAGTAAIVTPVAMGPGSMDAMPVDPARHRRRLAHNVRDRVRTRAHP